MGLFDFFKRRKQPQITTPEQLWTELQKAVQASDESRFTTLCREHQPAILEHIPVWKTAPEAIRNDPAAIGPYANTLIAVARYFDEVLGNPSLIQNLMGPPESNPLVQWQERLGQARTLMQELRYQEAGQLLTDLLIDVRELKGTGTDRYLPITLGHLGECHFQRGDSAGAIPHFERALRLCEESGDTEGVLVYLGNLYESHRYLGQATPAAEYAERLASAYQAQGQPAKAARMRRLAQVVRAGEPLNRLVAVIGEEEYELADVPPVDGRVQFNFQRNRPTLRPASELLERGKRLGQEGKLEEALEAFRAAAKADPFDPYARYEEGVTLLYLARFAEAVESYEATEELAPGWFHCRADLWLARQLALGALAPAVFLQLCELEDGPQSPEEKVRLADEALRAAPDIPHLHYHRGRALAALGRRAEAEAAFRAALDRNPEPDIGTRVRVELAMLLEDGAERQRLLEEAVREEGNLLSAATARLCMRRQGGGGR